MLMFKAQRGAGDLWNEWRKTIATKEEWGKRRPRLGAQFQNYLEAHNYIICRGWHSFEAFGGPRSQMKAIIHKDNIKSNDVACLQFHGNVGHVYAQPMARVNGWCTAEQGAAGQKLYQAQCATCHGSNLEGGAGPSLKGTACLLLTSTKWLALCNPTAC